MRTFISCVGLALVLCPPALAQSEESAISEYFKPLGPVNKHKTYHNAGNTQRIEYYCVDENAAPGKQKSPANARCMAALFLKSGGRWVFGDEMELGHHGSVLNFRDYRLDIQELEYGPDDATCCPTVGTTHIFTTQKGKLTEDKAAEEAAEANAPVKKHRK